MKEKEMMKKNPLYKSLPFSAKYKLDCLAKK